MPLFLHQHIEPEGEIGIWEITEDETWFLDRVHLWPSERAQMEAIKGRRRLEWLAVRHLVHHMSGREVRSAFLKDEFGKPHLEHSVYQISISHSDNMAAAIAAPFAVGIDIQHVVPKIERIAHKYMRPEEMDSLRTETRLEHLHVYWGAKEALYKAYGRRELDYAKHILIEPFAYNPAQGDCRGSIRKNSYEGGFKLHYRKIGPYIFVYAIASV
jgi:4'-phosphopantetheinyl transferase